MGIVKGVVRIASNMKYKHDLKTAKQRAFEETGKRMIELKKKGKYVSGRILYQERKQRFTRKAKEKKETRDSLINDFLK